MITITKCTGSGTNWNVITEPSPTERFKFTPKSLKVNIETIATTGSGRMADGSMNVGYLKPDLRKLEIELKPYKIGDDEVEQSVMQYVAGNVWQVKYLDPYTGNIQETRKMYCSSGSGDYYGGVILNGNDSSAIVQGAAFNLIEL